MMINDMYLRAARQPFKRDQRLGIDQCQGFDVFSRQVTGLDKRQFGAVKVQKSADIAVHPPGQNGQCPFVKYVSGQKRRKRVEISLFVGEDDVHTLILTVFRGFNEGKPIR